MWSVVSEPSSTLWFADWVDISVATVGSESLRVHVDYCWRRRADNDVTANKHCCSTATMTIKFISLGIVVDRVYHESRLPSEAPPMERSVMHLRSTHPLKNVDWCWRSSDSWPGFFLLRSRWSFWRKLTHYHCQAICMFTCMKKLLLVPDVVSTSRPSWGNFIGCQCDSEFKLAVLVYKAMNGLSSQYLADDCQLTSTGDRRRLQSSIVATC